jgi:transcriptional regulator with XRE-family HTH domain
LPYCAFIGIAYTRAMEALRQYFKDHSVSQAEFARDMKVSQPTVSDWVNGKIFPTTKKLRAIATRTGLSLDALLDVPKRKRN